MHSLFLYTTQHRNIRSQWRSISFNEEKPAYRHTSTYGTPQSMTSCRANKSLARMTSIPQSRLPKRKFLDKFLIFFHYNYNLKLYRIRSPGQIIKIYKRIFTFFYKQALLIHI